MVERKEYKRKKNWVGKMTKIGGKKCKETKKKERKN